MLHLLHPTILICIFAFSGLIVDAEMITFQSGPDLSPLKCVVLHTGLFAFGGTADDQGLVSFSRPSPGSFTSNIKIIEVYRQDGSHSAIHPSRVDLVQDSQAGTFTAIIKKGEPWREKIRRPSYNLLRPQARL